MKRAFFALAFALISLAGCKPEFEGHWNGHCLQVRSQDGAEYCFTNIRQAATVMNTDFAVARTIFLNAQERYKKEKTREAARKAAQR